MKKLPDILIVEDNEHLNILIQKTLKREGYNTKSAFNGTEAISMAADNPDILLLLDYILPDMKGNIVIETLIKRGLNIPFIIITGHGDEKTAVEMMKMGARDYIVKDAAFIESLPGIISKVIKEVSSRT